MPLPPGRTVPLSRGRRLVGDLLRASGGVPLVSVEREVRVPEVAAARAAADPRPGWYPVLLKAFALAARRVPDLRRSLLTFPYPRLYEHACSVATVTVERELDGEPAVLLFHVREPDARPLADIQAKFARVKTAPLREVPEFRRLLRVARLPGPARRLLWWLALRVNGAWRQKFAGTFGATSVVAAGAAVLTAVTPLSTVFTFGPAAADGSVVLRLAFDHRVMDGVAAARGLVETENALRAEILAELRALARPQRQAG